MKTFLVFFLVLAAVVAVFPPDLSASPLCACCAEQGHYSITTRKPDQYILGELKKLKLELPKLYTDAGYPETIKGIKPLGDSFSLDASVAGNLWRFIFKDNQSRSGTLNLAKPLSMVEYMVDQAPLTDGEPARMVMLYKEWRFKYNVASGNGIFQSGIAPKTEYFLVLQGKGNVCTSAEQFESWRLEITGTKARYAFFGKVSSN